MTAREWLANAAAWFVPPQEREEPVHTALDASAGSNARFVRELIGLAWFGYRRRGADVSGTDLRRVLADGLCNGAVWVVVFELADLLAHLRQGDNGRLDSWTAAGLLSLSLLLAFNGLDRLAGLAGIGWLVVWYPILAWYRPLSGMTALLMPLFGFVILIVAPRRRLSYQGRSLWLLLPVALALTAGPGNPPTMLIWVPVVLLVLVAAVLMLPTDPRLAIAAALPISYLGSQKLYREDTSSIVFTSTVLVVLAIAVLLRRYRSPQSAASKI